MVGLALSYALSITNLLSGLIFSFAQTEMQLVSVERTEEYSTCIPLEPQHGKAAVKETVMLKSTCYKGELCVTVIMQLFAQTLLTRFQLPGQSMVKWSLSQPF